MRISAWILFFLLWGIAAFCLREFVQSVEVQKEIRNEIQTLNATITDRLECVRDMYDTGKSELSVKRPK